MAKQLTLFSYGIHKTVVNAEAGTSAEADVVAELEDAVCEEVFNAQKQQREAKDKGTGELVFLPVRLLFLS